MDVREEAIVRMWQPFQAASMEPPKNAIVSIYKDNGRFGHLKFVNGTLLTRSCKFGSSVSTVLQLFSRSHLDAT